MRRASSSTENDGLGTNSTSNETIDSPTGSPVPSILVRNKAEVLNLSNEFINLQQQGNINTINIVNDEFPFQSAREITQELVPGSGWYSTGDPRAERAGDSTSVKLLSELLNVRT